MTDGAVALALWMQLHDSAFPAGRMVHSNGFEEWLACHPAAGPPEVAAAALDYLTFSVTTLDAAVTAAAWRASPALVSLRDLDLTLSSYKLSGNARTASQSAGLQLAVTALQVELCPAAGYVEAVVAGTTPGNLAVVEGVIQAAVGVDLHTAVLGSLRSALAAVLSAAVRLGRLGPLDAQRIQVRSAPAVVTLAESACALPLEELRSTTMQLEIAGMRHESRMQRLFAS